MDDDFEFPSPQNADNDDMDIPEDDPVAPILKVGEEKEIGKDGLKKKLLKEGEGWETPSSGDEVEGKLLIFDLVYFIYFCLGFDWNSYSDVHFVILLSSLYWDVARWN